MGKKILAEMASRIGELTRAQQKVADYILKDPIQAAFSTIEQLSRESETSTATVVRLAAFFGYDRYANFQKDLQSSIQKAMVPSYRLEENFQQIASKDTTVSDIISIQLGNLNATFDHLKEEDLHKISTRINAAGHVYVIGSRSCHGAAHYLAYNLNRISGKVDFLDPSDGSIGERLLRTGPFDMVISISFPRYITSVITATRIAKERGTYVLVITDSRLSPLIEYSDLYLLADCKSYDFHNSTLAVSLIFEVLISLVTRENPSLVKQYLQESEKILEEFSTHVNRE